MSPERVTTQSPTDDISVELSMRRTGMSFQRTRMSADRTLMSVLRTSLSLISFGFTIYSFFSKQRGEQGMAGARNFGSTLVLLGVFILVIGIAYHITFMKGLRAVRESMKAEGQIFGESVFPPSLVLITALLLLAVGVLAVLSMVYHVGPFD